MSKRRTHSSLDSLPQDVKDAVNLMIVDLQFPEDFPRRAGFGFKGDDSEVTGVPKYDDVVEYCKARGYTVSRSAVGRYAMQVRTLSRMKQAGVITRDIMKNTSEVTASETQKAVSEMITAVAIEFISDHQEFSAEDLRDVAKAMKDCTAIAINADKYIQQKIDAKIKEADEKITAIAAKKQFDPETLRMIREEIYGITN